MRIDIHIVDDEIIAQRDMGIEVGYITASYNFPDSQFGGYWIDPDTKNLNFYSNGRDFTTSDTKESRRKFDAVIRAGNAAV